MRHVTLAAVLVTGSSACGAGSGSAGTGRITVFAAASLTDAFTAVADEFEASNTASAEASRVTLSFAASSELVTQIVEGAPADVFASADRASMDVLVDAGAARGDPVVFATNELAIVVAPGNPEGITGLPDLAGDDLLVVTCAPEVPCGAYARQALGASGVALTPVSLEENVRAVVAKVALGEADAGIVYATDAVAAGDDVDAVAIPDDVNVVAEYPIAVTADARSSATATEFLAFVLSERGQEILAGFGFGAP
jgi:molybdate transport system substrate-binding protein